MEELNESLYEKILDFDSTRRAEWTEKREPYAVLFELTPKCNFNCVHCYLHNNHGQGAMSTEQIKRILDLLCDKGIVFITLTGGEILTRSDFCEVYMHAKRKLFSDAYLW